MTFYFIWRQTSSREIRGSHGRNYKKFCLPGYGAVWHGGILPTY